MASLPQRDMHWVSWPGVCTCVVGGVLYLFSCVQNKQASQLEAAVPLEKLSDLKSLVKLVPFLASVTARTWTDSPLKCALTDRGAVISEETEQQLAMRQVESGSWVSDEQTVRHVRREVPWCLEDGSRARLPVLKGAKADEVYMETVGDEYVPQDQGLARRAIDNLLGFRLLGLRRTERILPVGVTLAAVGEVARAADAGAAAIPGALRAGAGEVLVLRAPANGGPFILSSRPLPELVASAAATARRCRLLAACFGGLGAALIVEQVVRTALAARRRRRLRKLLAEAEQQRRATAAAAAAAGGGGGGGAGGAPANGHAAGAADEGAAGEGAAGEGMCVVCFAQPCDTVFPACGHMCACGGCAPALARCPICRARGGCIRVYRT